jgi:hypothetical protein
MPEGCRHGDSQNTAIFAFGVLQKLSRLQENISQA